MKILFLGSGTSTGVPVIGCRCNTCNSGNPKNKRTRASILITNDNNNNILIDTSTDLRFQALTYHVTRIDAVFFTHAHADHIHGIDELRSFNHIQKTPIPCYGSLDTMEVIKHKFSYIFDDSAKDNWMPHLQINVVNGQFELHGLEILPLKIFHGEKTILGYRMNGVAYLTDCSGIPDSTKDSLREMALLILDATRYQPHIKHYGLAQAIRVVEELKPERAVLTHLSHAFDHTKVNNELPPGIELAYDGMEIEVRGKNPTR